MSRTGTDENKAANAELAKQQAQAYANANADREAYNAKVSEIEKAGNPFDYNSPTGANNLRNWNTLVGSASSAETKAAEDEIEQSSKRTGLNTASTPYLKAELGRQRARDMATARASQAVDDSTKAAQWNQWLAAAKLGGAGVDTSLYGTSTSGRSAALENLAKLGMASYGPWQAAIGAAGQIGASLVGNLGKGGKG